MCRCEAGAEVVAEQEGGDAHVLGDFGVGLARGLVGEVLGEARVVREVLGVAVEVGLEADQAGEQAAGQVGVLGRHRGGGHGRRPSGVRVKVKRSAVRARSSSKLVCSTAQVRAWETSSWTLSGPRCFVSGGLQSTV